MHGVRRQPKRSQAGLSWGFAVIFCQDLFKELAEDESFLYLAKSLGFTLNVLLFSAHANRINAPDYLSAALEFQDRYSDAFRDMDGQSDCFDHFCDMDMFSGISASTASVIYTLGTLMKWKKAGLQVANMSHAEYLQTFESDVHGLDATSTTFGSDYKAPRHKPAVKRHLPAVT